MFSFKTLPIIRFACLTLILAAILSCSNDFDASAFKGGSSRTKEGDIGSITIADYKNDTCLRSGAKRDIVFILDSTTSVTDENWMHFISVLHNITVTLHPEQTKVAVFEFGNTKGLKLDAAVAGGKVSFLVGSPSAFASNMGDVVNIISSHRRIREGSYDGVGPAILKAKEYLERVGRPGASKEIWAIHDMSCCGFPATGETGTQIDDAKKARDAGMTVVGIRTLRSAPAGDQIATPGLAFDLGADLKKVTGEVLTKLSQRVSSVVCK